MRHLRDVGEIMLLCRGPDYWEKPEILALVPKLNLQSPRPCTAFPPSSLYVASSWLFFRFAWRCTTTPTLPCVATDPAVCGKGERRLVQGSALTSLYCFILGVFHTWGGGDIYLHRTLRVFRDSERVASQPGVLRVARGWDNPCGLPSKNAVGERQREKHGANGA